MQPAELAATASLKAAGVGAQAAWDRRILDMSPQLVIVVVFRMWHNQSPTEGFPGGISFRTAVNRLCNRLVDAQRLQTGDTGRDGVDLQAERQFKLMYRAHRAWFSRVYHGALLLCSVW